MAEKISYILAEIGYEVWLTSLYGSADGAYMKGVKPWEQLPEKTQDAWSAVVVHIVNSVMDSCKQLERTQ